MLPDIVLTRRDHGRLTNIVQALNLRSRPALADFLDQEISRARIVDPSDMPKNVATMGAQLVYRDDDTGTERVVVLVYPVDEDSASGRLSVLSPLGTALLGLSDGQSISWTTRDGRQRRVSLLSVLSQPEVPGD